jgi:hypothetical protein
VCCCQRQSASPPDLPRNHHGRRLHSAALLVWGTAGSRTKVNSSLIWCRMGAAMVASGRSAVMVSGHSCSSARSQRVARRFRARTAWGVIPFSAGRPVVDLADNDHPSSQRGILGILPFELVDVSPQMCPAALLESGQVVIVTDQGLYIGLGCAIRRGARLVALGRLLAFVGQASRSPNIGDRERIVGNRC